MKNARTKIGQQNPTRRVWLERLQNLDSQIKPGKTQQTEIEGEWGGERENLDDPAKVLEEHRVSSRGWGRSTSSGGRWQHLVVSSSQKSPSDSGYFSSVEDLRDFPTSLLSSLYPSDSLLSLQDGPGKLVGPTGPY